MVPATTKDELDKVLKQHPEIKEVFIDGTERPVQRSGDYESQKKDYSGKKKRHTKKNMIIAGNNKMIVGVSETQYGKKHDYSMLKESGFMEVLLGYVIRVDLGYQGIKTIPIILSISQKKLQKKPSHKRSKTKTGLFLA